MSESTRDPCLHQNPEIIAMPRTRSADACIEVAQHTDGRWMWATSWMEGFSGMGYCCGVKWGKFAPSRSAAIASAVAEIMRQTESAGSECREVRAWVNSICPAQGDLFGVSP